MKVAIIGSGKIACDLLIKVMRSKSLECVMFAGQRKESPGIAFANGLGAKTSSNSVAAVVESDAEIVFDCTTSKSAKIHMKLLKDRFFIDLTPAKVFPVCVPGITAITGRGVNMGSCSIQAVIPTLMKLKNLSYVELVTTIASDSAGMGTRENISEYLKTTAKTITEFTGAKAKAILVINPILQKMHNTVYYKTKGSDKVKILQFELSGHGDYLDKRFGNLDIMTAKALEVAEDYVKNISN